MPQKIFTKFRDPVNSFPLGEMNLGILKPGRYSGFDVMTEITGLNVRISHQERIKKTTIALSEITFGNALTPNGSIVHYETNGGDLGISLTLDTNVGNANVRYDYLVCEHEYIEVVGGQPAVFFIQKGPNDGELPELPNPEKQVILGTFTITAGGYQFSDITYTKATVPLLGDAEISEFINLILNYATEGTPGLIQLISTGEVTEANEALANDTKAITLKRLLERTATATRKGISAIASAANTLLGTETTTTVTPALMRRYSGISKKAFLTGNLTISDANQADYNGLILIANGGSGLINIIMEKLTVSDFSLGIITETRNVRILEGTDVTLSHPAISEPETLNVGSGILIESNGVSNSGVYLILGELKPTT